MSKLQDIIKALESNPDILPIREIIETKKNGEQYGQSIDFLVAPKEGLYTVGELNDFRKLLASYLCFEGIVPYAESCDSQGSFAQTSNSLVIGRLGFEEVVAHYKRRIRVEIFPSEDIVKGILQQEINYECNSIKLKDFKKYIPLSQRISLYGKGVADHFISKPNSQ